MEQKKKRGRKKERRRDDFHSIDACIRVRLFIINDEDCTRSLDASSLYQKKEKADQKLEAEEEICVGWQEGCLEARIWSAATDDKAQPNNASVVRGRCEILQGRPGHEYISNAKVYC